MGEGGSGTNIDNSVDLTDFRKEHILNNHKYGVGKPDKTEFPQNWNNEKILHYVSDIATDPNAIWGMGFSLCYWGKRGYRNTS
ncbi:MAG: EndoU domain-containing protein [Clostridium sp.]|nr:EndoU domain-containing protein [Clostridium sp.]MCM1181060.1 EndoU domain-containing protein [Clostridium sp.]